MDCWDTCTICHAGDVTDDAYAARVGRQLATLAALIEAPPEPYSPEQDPFYSPPAAERAVEHRRTEILRAAYALKRAECTCGWLGDWHPYNQLDLMEADWATHLEGTK